MSVGQATGTEYDDFDVQHARSIITVESGDTLTLTTAEQVNSIEPVGGLTRDEIAELVSLTYHVAAVSETASPLDNTTFSISYEWTSDSEMRLSRGDLPEVTADLEGTGLQLLADSEVDVDRLLFGHVRSHGGHSDDTNGEGGGHDDTTDLWQIPYRTWYGSGPTYDRHNELFENVEVNVTGGFVGRFITSTTFVWDVRDRS